jgi:hypothetical protein
MTAENLIIENCNFTQNRFIDKLLKKKRNDKMDNGNSFISAIGISIDLWNQSNKVLNFFKFLANQFNKLARTYIFSSWQPLSNQRIGKTCQFKRWMAVDWSFRY